MYVTVHRVGSAQRRYDSRGAAQAISLCNDVGCGRKISLIIRPHPTSLQSLIKANCLSCTAPVVPPLGSAFVCVYQYFTYFHSCSNFYISAGKGLIKKLTEQIVMPQCACESEVYGIVSVCVCLGCYSCSGINEVQVRVSIGF